MRLHKKKSIKCSLHASDQITIKADKSQVKIKQIDQMSSSTPSKIFNKVINTIPNKF